MKLTSNVLSKCNTCYLKKEYIFLALIVSLMLFSFLGSTIKFQNFFHNDVRLEGYSDIIESKPATQPQATQPQATQTTLAQTTLADTKNNHNPIKEKFLSREIYMGIPRSQIPIGHEDLYIRKSQVVPPVCPECPPLLNEETEDDVDKCPPCASCNRCPEPAFMCKEIPSDSSNPSANAYLPRPMLTNFGEFGI